MSAGIESNDLTHPWCFFADVGFRPEKLGGSEPFFFFSLRADLSATVSLLIPV